MDVSGIVRAHRTAPHRALDEERLAVDEDSGAADFDQRCRAGQLSVAGKDMKRDPPDSWLEEEPERTIACCPPYDLIALPDLGRAANRALRRADLKIQPSVVAADATNREFARGRLAEADRNRRRVGAIP